MTASILAGFAGALAMLVLMLVAAAIVELASWLVTPRNAPDEHADLTPHIELYDMEAPR